MKNFEYYNPVRIVFGKGTISALGSLVLPGRPVLLIYGGGSIKRNGVYTQVMEALKARRVIEFGGIEPNPQYETCMRAVALARAEQVGFLLAAGGGSVLDGTKFIAAAVKHKGKDPWDILGKDAPVTEALPLGCVLTLPATGSEANGAAVISRAAPKNEKLFFTSQHVFPKFSILDPATTYSLPPRQVANGIADAFVHVIEQYLTYPVNAPLQDRQAEAILLTLMEEAPRVKTNPNDYEVRANLMWCATQALNGLIGCGVPQDWATHMIGHELTALYGIDHAQSLAIVLPSLWRHRKSGKAAKLAQLARRVFGVKKGLAENAAADLAIEKTEAFFLSVGVRTKLADYGIDARDAARRVSERLAARGINLGERSDLTPEDVSEILRMSE